MTKTDAPKKIRNSTQDSVYHALRKSILTLNLLPGTAISEKEISLRYEVSRTPVREAFIHLSKESLVQVIPQKETLVSLIDLKRVEQEHFLRESLEMAVLEPFIKNAQSHHFKELQRYIDMQAELTDGKEYVRFVACDDGFHKTFFDAAGQLLSWEIIENMSGHYFRVRLLTIWLKGVAADIVGQHQKLLDALRNKELGNARKLLSRHLHKLNIEEKMLLKEFPAYFVKEAQRNTFDVDFGGLNLSR
ncbi:GntR family transcriptional regulator [Treponema sp. OttesenSCG-928-L16]|nr:GntR family transcriptional regulator [Treponema sp. OttesenSCG-928-L16]